MNEDAVNRGVFVEAVDVFEELGFGDVRGVVFEGAGDVGLSKMSVPRKITSCVLSVVVTSSAAFSFMRT